MISIEPNITATGRYTIGEAADALGVHRNTLRRYALAGAIKFGIRRTNNRMFFTGAEILRFWKTN